MSGEVAQSTREDTVHSNGIAKEVPPSSSPPAAAEAQDTAALAATPVNSTFLISAPSTGQTSPLQEASRDSTVLGSTNAQPSSISLSQNEEPSEVQGGAAASLQSSPSNAQTLTSPPGNERPEGLEQSVRRDSEASIKAKRRSGSLASSKRSTAANPALPPAVLGQEKAGVSSTASSTKQKKQGVSKFLSFLNCCSATEDATVVELGDQAVPAKKAKGSQSNRNRQTTPMTKVNANAEASGTGRSKEAAEEAIGGPPYSELTPAAKPKMVESPKKDVEKMGKTSSPSIVVPTSGPEEKALPPSSSGQSPPAIPNINDPPLPQGALSAIHQKSTNGSREPSIKVTSASQHGVSDQDMAINDRTSQQEKMDTDIEMTDAPQAAPGSESHPKDQDTRDETQGQITIPPPPPRTTQDFPTGTERRTSNGFTSGEQQKWLLPPMNPRFKGKKCLVLDLDETLVHSSFKILHQADFTIPVEIEGQFHNVYVIKRPGVDQFMKRVGELYEVVVFTASVAKYGDPLLDQLDIHKVVHHRLFRESCYNHQGNYVKDLSQVGRDLRETIIIDNSPTSYIFHPQHAVPISSWFSDAHDNELLDLIPVLEDLAGPQVRDVSLVLDVGL
ncbi:MAG: hypothetical protein Q9167_007192 [Letrouitia subvulpina]